MRHITDVMNAPRGETPTAGEGTPQNTQKFLRALFAGNVAYRNVPSKTRA